MGRGVMTKGEHIVYFDYDSEIEDNWMWDEMVANLAEILADKYKSLWECSKWEYREIDVFLENYHIQIGIAEYCGCGAVSVWVNDSSEYPELSENWLNQVWGEMQKIIEQNVYGEVLRRLGTMSNGISIYERKNQ